MYRLYHGFRFIDPIKTESNWSKFLELFGLTLNTANIKIPNVGTPSVGITSVEIS